MSKKETLLFSILMFAAVILAFATGYLYEDLTGHKTATFPLLTQAEEILRSHAYNPIPDDPALEYGMIRGMIEAYGDPFTSFYEPVQHELQTNELQGAFGGIGATVERDPEGNVRLYPFPDGPADKAGVLPEDILTKVDELEITSEMSYGEITAAVRGKVGTDVRINIFRESDEEHLDFKIEREEVPLPSVTWRLGPGAPEIGLIEVNLMAESTVDEIENAAKALSEMGASYFVLDLRDNRGGLLHAGIECARLFLKEGEVMQQQYRGKDIVTYDVEKPGALSDLPLAVWVNQNTASAAEICAGALQMHGFILFGTHTFGKDAIQLVFELDDGSSVQITAAKWWFPDLEFPNNGVGLLPDVSVDGSTNDFITVTLEHTQ